jgi:hypothetical protein
MLEAELFNTGYCLFLQSENGLSNEPNKASSINIAEHISYFNFARRIIAASIF